MQERRATWFLGRPHTLDTNLCKWCALMSTIPKVTPVFEGLLGNTQWADFVMRCYTYSYSYYFQMIYWKGTWESLFRNYLDFQLGRLFLTPCTTWTVWVFFASCQLAK